MCELRRDVTPVGRVQDHHITKDVKAYLLQVPVESFISVLKADSQGTSRLLKHAFL